MPDIRDPFWTIHPVTGDKLRVLPAILIEDAQAKQHDAELQLDVMRECAARLRIVYRKAVHNWTEDEAAQHRDALRDGLAHMAKGCPVETEAASV